jgi:5-formyltetrahydrofolate cyclo-ligase
VLTAVLRSFLFGLRFAYYVVPMFFSLMSRQQLRHKLLHIRRHLDSSWQQIVAHKIAAKICASNIFAQSQNIACYLAIKGEVDLTPIIQQIWLSKKNCYLPLLDPKEKRNLCFLSYKESDQLSANKYNILQPIYAEEKLIAPQNLDLVIAPLVGFDIGGNRLGQGGGYYDYTFAFKRLAVNGVVQGQGQRQGDEIKPYLLGVAYEWQNITDDINFVTSSWDVRLDAVVTDEAWYVF